MGNVPPRNKNLYSNYNKDSDIDSSSSPDSHNDTTDLNELDDETHEGEEESSPLSEHISQNDDADLTESRMPVVARNGASSAIGEAATQASKQITPTILHRPSDEQPGEQSAPVKQARCDALAAQLRVLRGGYPLQDTKTAQQQAETIRQLVTQYSDGDIAWIQLYAFRFSEQYRGVKVGPTYASVLLEVAPTALRAADPQMRVLLMQQSQQPEARPPEQPAPPDNNPYSLTAQLARQNGRQS